MIYLLTAASATMLGFMAWTAVFRMRPDRVRAQRRLTRGKFAFRPRERTRFLLGQAFQVSKDKPEWEDPLVSSLDEAAVKVQEPQ